MDRLAAIVEGSSDAIIAATLDGTITDWNPAAHAMFGYTAEEAVGGSVSMLIPADRPNEQAHLLGRVRQGEQVTSYETVRQRKDGSQVEVALTLSPIRTHKGEIAGASVLARDITEHKRLEQSLCESQAWFRDLFNSMGVGVYATDADGHIQRYNEMMAQLWGRRPAVGERAERYCAAIQLSQLDGTPLPHAHCPMAQTVHQGRPVHGEVVVHRPDGTAVTGSAHAAPVRDEHGEMIGAVNCVVDITDRQRAEQAAAREHEEAKRRAEQLQHLTAELTQTEQRERRRLARLLHDDLQQLLVAVKMRLGTLKHVDAETLPHSVDQLSQYMDKAIASTRSLSQELSPPVLYDGGLAQALQWLSRRMAEDHGLTVHLEADESVRIGDEAMRVMLFEAARELLFNVVKHGRTDESWARLSRHETCVELSIEDQGAGFELDPNEASTAGNFGLMTLRERLHWLGGTMHVSSAPGAGTSIGITVPSASETPTSNGEAAAAEDDRAQAPAVEPHSADAIRVMLVDDHSVVREGLATLMKESGDIAIVAEAGSGEQAIELAEQHQPDVVIMDVTIQGINGVEATRRITSAYPGTRVIGLSVHPAEDMAERMRQVGAEAYLNKAGPADDLLAAIRGARHEATSDSA